MLKGRKVAGILLETEKRKSGQDALLIGVGVNLLTAPDSGDLEGRATPPAALFPETGIKVTPERFLDTLMSCYARLEALFQQDGFYLSGKAGQSGQAILGSRSQQGFLTRHHRPI